MQNKQYNVVISKRAKELLVSNAAFIAQVSQKAALQLTEEFTKAAKSLQTMPQRCPRLSFDGAVGSGYRKLIFEKHYLMIYQICDDTVFIDYIVDAKQDYQWLIQ